MMNVTFAPGAYTEPKRRFPLTPSLSPWVQVQGYSGVLPDVLACPAEPS